MILAFLFIPSILPAQESGPLGLPFSTDETTGTATLIVRHKATWNRRTGAVSWKKLEAEIPDRATIRVKPGVYDPNAEKPQAIHAEIDLRGGKFAADYRPRADATYAATLDAALQPRDVQWNDPATSIKGLALEATIEIDSALKDDPLRALMKLDLRRLLADSIEAGVYRAEKVSIAGNWTRPEWRLDSLAADLFGGHLQASGSGDWGTTDAPSVSIQMSASGIDVQKLLLAFNIPRAAEIQARATGSLRIEARGRKWSAMEFDVAAEPGSVALSRDLVRLILGPIYRDVVGMTEDDVDKVIEAHYGDAASIPFDRAALTASLKDGILRAEIPLENRALKLDNETRIEEAVLWDIWDGLIDAGAQNLRGAAMNGGKKGNEK